MAPASDQGASARAATRARLAPVESVQDERGYLYELIQTISAGPDLDAILRGVVRLVTEATSCHACFVYFRRDYELVLRAASAIYEHLEGEVRIPLGEGLAGWVAETRRPAYVRERALEDSRVRRAYFPELGDEVYQSLVSVPIFARAGDVIGVVSVHAEAPHEFGRDDLDLLEHTASLVSGAIENATLYEDAANRVERLSQLSQLSQRIAGAEGIDQLVRIVLGGASQILGATRAEILLAESSDRLISVAARPARRNSASVDVDAIWPAHRREQPDHREIVGAVWGEQVPGIPMAARLETGSERLGVLVLSAPSVPPDGEAILSAVAAHTSVAIRQHQVIESLTEQNLVKDLFEALSHPERSAERARALARRLDLALDHPSIVIHGIPQERKARRRGGQVAREWDEVALEVETRLVARFPSALVDTLDGSIRAIVPTGESPGETVEAMVAELVCTGPGGREALEVSIGISDPCRGAGAFARAFDEAASAAEVGGLLRGKPGVMTYQDLGPYRYLLRSEDGASDPLQLRLERLVDYDHRRGTRLLDTLEGYLDHRGNVVASSKALYIHPNTLRQRLDRIGRETEMDLGEEDWLSLAVATKVVKLRSKRRTAREEEKHG